MAKLPFFFYGTLQTGFQNHNNVVRGRFSSIVPARVSRLRLVHYPVGFPGAYPGGEDDFVFGELLTPTEHSYEALIRELDLLEDFIPGRVTNQYDRRVMHVDIFSPDSDVLNRSSVPLQRVEAYVYVSLLDAESNSAETVPSGDWRAWMAARGLKDAGDDWSHVLKEVNESKSAAENSHDKAVH